MTRWLSRLVDVRAGEGPRVASMFALLGLIIATSYILKPVRSALFLSQFGSARLPYVYILVAIVLGFVAAAFAKWAPAANLPRLLRRSAYFFAANLAGFWFLTASGWPYTGFVFYVWVSIFTALMPSLFWLLANYVFYSNEGRRLFPVVMAGGLLGSILGGALTSILVRFVGTSGLLLAAAGVLLAVAEVVRFSSSLARERMAERRAELSRQERRRPAEALEGPYALVRRSRYLSMIAAMIFITTLTSTLVDFQFNTAAEASYQTMDALTGFFGTLFAAINVAAFLLQLLVVGRLLSRFGVGGGLLALPLALLSSSIAFLVAPRLLTAALVKSADDGLSNSVNKASVEVLYLPVSLSVKNRLKTWLDLFVERVSRGVAGLMILGATTLLALSPSQISLVVTTLLIPWIALVFLLRREYVKAFRDSLSRRDIADFASELRDPESLSLLQSALSSEDDREIFYALELLHGLDEPNILKQVSALSAHANPAVRRAAIQLLRESPTPLALEDFDSLVLDPDRNVAAEALSLWIRVDAERGYLALQRLVDSGDNPRIQAVLDTMNLEESVPMSDIETFVAERSTAEDAASRRMAARAARYLDDEQGASCLLQLVRDRDIAVARDAVASIGAKRYDAGFELLVEALGRRPLRAAARDAISTFGPDRIQSLAASLKDPRLGEDVRRAIPLVLAQFDDQKAADALFEALPNQDPTIHYHAIKGLGKMRMRFPDVHFPKSRVDLLLEREASEVAELAALRQGIASEPAPHPSYALLLKILSERLESARERIFRLLGLLYAADTMFTAWARVGMGLPSVRGTALEFLSNLLESHHRDTLLPLVEAATWEDLQTHCRRIHGGPAMNFHGALKRLAHHRDDWLAATAITLFAKLERRSSDLALDRLRDHDSEIVREALAQALAVRGDSGALHRERRGARLARRDD